MNNNEYVRDFFGTPIYVGDTVTYPASGHLENAEVIEIVSEEAVRTRSGAGTKKIKYGRDIVNYYATFNTLREKYPENFI